jgi:hypothetical protein
VKEREKRLAGLDFQKLEFDIQLIRRHTVPVYKMIWDVNMRFC